MFASHDDSNNSRTLSQTPESTTQPAITIRVASADDAERMLSMYGPMVENTVITFEDHPPELTSFQDRVQTTLEQYPWLIAEIEGVLVGYCYAVRHRQRPAYAWSCESSVYVAEGQRKRGVGRALYEHLFKVLQLQGFRNVLAILTLPNTPSVRLHESVGFQRIGMINHAGFKHGKWRDVLWMSKDLYSPDMRDQPDHPIDRPKPFPDVFDSGQLKSIL